MAPPARLTAALALFAAAAVAPRGARGQLQPCSSYDDACFTADAGRLGDRVCAESCLAADPYCATDPSANPGSCTGQWLTHPCPGLISAGISLPEMRWNANPASGQDWATSDGVAVCTTCPAGKYVDAAAGYCKTSTGIIDRMLQEDVTEAECALDPDGNDCATAAAAAADAGEFYPPCMEWVVGSPPWASSTTGSALCADCPAGTYQDLNNPSPAYAQMADPEACSAAYAAACPPSDPYGQCTTADGTPPAMDESLDPGCRYLPFSASDACTACPAGTTSPAASESEDACVPVLSTSDKTSDALRPHAASALLAGAGVLLGGTLA